MDISSSTLPGIIGIGIYDLLSMVLKGSINKVINEPATLFAILSLLLVALLLISQWMRINRIPSHNI